MKNVIGVIAIGAVVIGIGYVSIPLGIIAMLVGAGLAREFFT